MEGRNRRRRVTKSELTPPFACSFYVISRPGPGFELLNQGRCPQKTARNLIPGAASSWTHGYSHLRLRPTARRGPGGLGNTMRDVGKKPFQGESSSDTTIRSYSSPIHPPVEISVLLPHTLATHTLKHTYRPIFFPTTTQHQARWPSTARKCKSLCLVQRLPRTIARRPDGQMAYSIPASVAGLVRMRNVVGLAVASVSAMPSTGPGCGGPTQRVLTESVAEIDVLL
ncbi:hypothetical protein VTK73DRAFT_2714 [Phialemonium thermophilum]|uniref:Uncharacterized protein n=1 Tax=Phialemonium thermophilum TaxID=223376 RepID=A0ABR3VQL7_9PEZI